MCLIIVGDTHGTVDIGKVVHFFEGREDEFTKEDYLVICGDAGVCGFSASEEAETSRTVSCYDESFQECSGAAKS